MRDDAPRMGEDRTGREHEHGQPTAGHGQPKTGQRVTVREAADELGITVEAVRNRIKRGTLSSEKESGTVYVLLDRDHVRADQPGAGRDRTRDQTQPDERPAELVEELRDRIAYLERQVEEEREARRRADTLMARLMERVPELPAAPMQEPRESPESATETEPGTNTPTASASPQRPVQRRSWWQRLLGG